MRFILTGLLLCLTLAVSALEIGLIADAQYAEVEPSIGRHYAQAPARVAHAVQQLNDRQVDLTVQLGDLIDRDVASFGPMLAALSQLERPVHHVLGNHEFSVADADLPQVRQLLGVEQAYRAISQPGWRLLLLDGTDISLYVHPSGSQEAADALAWRAAHAPQAARYGGAIGQQQLQWIDQQLAAADAAGERVILFCHFPLLPDSRYALWNAPEVLAVIEQHPSAVAWVNGHRHSGGVVQQNGRWFVTIRGMVETEEQTAFAALRCEANQLTLTGWGRQETLVLNLQPEVE